MTSHKVDVAVETMKSTPPLAVIVAGTLGGYSLQDWVLVATLIYIGLQVGWLLYKWYKAARKKGWAPGDE
jgi:hypothetical protein